MASPVGSICHLELFAVNLDISAGFYYDLFGWTTVDHDEGYRGWRDTGGLSGGFTTAGAPVTNPAATVYIKVDDIPAKMQEIITKGGTAIRPKTAIGSDHGYYSLFRDPAGNNIGLWSSS